MLYVYKEKKIKYKNLFLSSLPSVSLFRAEHSVSLKKLRAHHHHQLEATNTTTAATD